MDGSLDAPIDVATIIFAVPPTQPLRALAAVEPVADSHTILTACPDLTIDIADDARPAMP